MSHVFISYARADQAAAERLRYVLDAEGWDVWWDQDLYAGARWEDGILHALERAKAVLVVWSKRAAKSRWVARELEVAYAADKLVPCSLDGTLPPSPYDALEVAALRGWPEREENAELSALFAGVERFTKPTRLDDVRPGFDFEFLGTTVDFPELPGVGDELPYLHFSVVINPARRLPWYVAYNIEPQTFSPVRPSQWQPDPRISPLFQPGNEHFLGTGFDRGHLVAPKTVAWGDERHAKIAIRQAFFWTNTSPQAPWVNQRSWQRIEERERNLASLHRRTVGFSGPVLANDDPAHTVTDELRGRVRAHQTFHTPQRYWKVVVARAGTDLRTSAHFVDNTDGSAAESCSVEAIEAMTGLMFPAVVREAARLPD